LLFPAVVPLALLREIGLGLRLPLRTLVLRQPDEIGERNDINYQHHGKRHMHLRRYIHVNDPFTAAWPLLDRAITFAKRHASLWRRIGARRVRASPRNAMRVSASAQRVMSTSFVSLRNKAPTTTVMIETRIGYHRPL